MTEVAHLKVTSLGGSWSKSINDQTEYENILRYRADKSRSGYNCCIALFKPIRTNNCKNFIKDFFLPSVVNVAWKVESLAYQLFMIIFLLPWDLLTFPVRVFTTLPRCIANRNAPEHPLSIYLKKEGVPNELLAEGRVRVTLIVQDADKKEEQDSMEVVDLIEMPDRDESYNIGVAIRSKRV